MPEAGDNSTCDRVPAGSTSSRRPRRALLLHLLRHHSVWTDLYLLSTAPAGTTTSGPSGPLPSAQRLYLIWSKQTSTSSRRPQRAQLPPPVQPQRAYIPRVPADQLPSLRPLRAHLRFTTSSSSPIRSRSGRGVEFDLSLTFRSRRAGYSGYEYKRVSTTTRSYLRCHTRLAYGRQPGWRGGRSRHLPRSITQNLDSRSLVWYGTSEP